MIRQNLTLLPNCSGKISVEGEPVKSIGYYINETNDRLNTISIHTKNFTGRIYIYGSLKINPTDDDWAIIPIGKDADYLEFNHLGVINECMDNTFVNIRGSYTWLKAKMDRDYLNIIKTPVEINYHLTQGTCSQNVNSDVSIPMSNKEITVKRDVSGDLIHYGNVTNIMLCY